MNAIQKETLYCFDLLSDFINQLSSEDYISINPILKNSSVGMHVRHILEFYEALINQVDGTLNYDLRKRSLELEVNKKIALKCITQIKIFIFTSSQDYSLFLKGDLILDNDFFHSSFYRELLYALEHMIHHMAIIKIATNQSDIKLHQDFGVAYSTRMAKGEICAQ